MTTGQEVIRRLKEFTEALERGEVMLPPTPRMPLPWLENPAYDNAGDMPYFLVGDRILVAVPLHAGGYDMSVIVASEWGFDMDGEAWSAWDWSDVKWYIPLDGVREERDGA